MKSYQVTRDMLEQIRNGGPAVLSQEVESGDVVELIAPTIHSRDDMNIIVVQALDVTKISNGWYTNFRL